MAEVPHTARLTKNRMLLIFPVRLMPLYRSQSGFAIELRLDSNHVDEQQALLLYTSNDTTSISRASGMNGQLAFCVAKRGRRAPA